MSLSQDNSRLVMIDSDGKISIMNTETGEVILTMKDDESDEIIIGAFSRNNQLLATGRIDGSVKILSLNGPNAGERLLTLCCHDSHAFGLDFSPDHTKLVTASWDGTAKVWDLSTGTEILTFDKHSDRVWSAQFSPDGQRVATGSRDTNIKTWDAETGQELLTLSGHTGSVFGVIFSQDGKFLASRGLDGLVKLWDAKTGEELISFTGHKNDNYVVNYLSFSPDGRYLVSSAWFGAKVRVWVLEAEELLDLAYARLTRWFMPEECKQYLHTDTCPPDPRP